METSRDGDARGGETRLRLDGVGTPILTRVTRSSARGMTVEQTLPFLRLDTVVLDEAAQRSRIASVSMVVYDGVPRLVLDLAYDAAPDAEPRAVHRGVVRPRRDDTAAFARGEACAGSPPRDAAGVASAASAQTDECAGRESTLLFPAQPAGADEPAHTPVDLTLEQELMRSRQLAYRLRAGFEAARPRLERAARAAFGVGRRWVSWLAPRLACAGARSLQTLSAALRALRGRFAAQSSKLTS